jgi:hypothetical protein
LTLFTEARTKIRAKKRDASNQAVRWRKMLTSLAQNADISCEKSEGCGL